MVAMAGLASFGACVRADARCDSWRPCWLPRDGLDEKNPAFWRVEHDAPEPHRLGRFGFRRRALGEKRRDMVIAR